jgi:hypothetical protein
MKWLFVISFLFVSGTSLLAQSAKEIVQKGIEVKRIYQQDIVDGEKESTLWKEEFYNFRGDLIEIKEYSNQGKQVKLWFKYKYDSDGNMTESIEYDSRGVVKEHFVDKFEKGLRTERIFYDEKGRVIRKRTYKYEIRK